MTATIGLTLRTMVSPFMQLTSLTYVHAIKVSSQNGQGERKKTNHCPRLSLSIVLTVLAGLPVSFK